MDEFYETLMSAADVRDQLPRPAWHDHAACRGMGTAVFFPELGDTAAAADICAGCPVKDECADAGAGERYGVWGGLSVRQRRRQTAA